LRQLAEQRGKTARDWLVEKRGIYSDRVFVLEPGVDSEIDGKEIGSKAKFTIRIIDSGYIVGNMVTIFLIIVSLVIVT